MKDTYTWYILKAQLTKPGKMSLNSNNRHQENCDYVINILQYLKLRQTFTIWATATSASFNKTSCYLTSTRIPIKNIHGNSGEMVFTLKQCPLACHPHDTPDSPLEGVPCVQGDLWPQGINHPTCPPCWEPPHRHRTHGTSRGSNSLRPDDAFICQWTGSSLVQVMAWH